VRAFSAVEKNLLKCQEGFEQYMTLLRLLHRDFV